MLFAGVSGIEGIKVGGPPIPGLTPAGVLPSPIAGGCPCGAWSNGAAVEAPYIRGLRSVVRGEPDISHWAKPGTLSSDPQTAVIIKAIVAALRIFSVPRAKLISRLMQYG